MQYTMMFGPMTSVPGFLRRWLVPPFKHPRAVPIEVTFDITTPQPTRKPVDRPLPRPPAHIPNELILYILQAGYSPDNTEPDHEMLMQCSLVSKDWSVLAQQLLFSDVTLRTEPAYTSFQRAVDRSTPRGCMLGNAVTSLRVTLDPNHPQCLTERAFAQAVTLTPNLVTLRVAVYGQGAPGLDIIGSPAQQRMRRGAPSFDPTTLFILRSGPRIKTLQLSDWSDNPTSLVQLLDIWPSVQSLEICGTPPSLPSPSPEPCPCALQELRINVQMPPSVDVLEWLTYNSKDTLRVLDLKREPEAEMLDYLLGEHSATLESLSIPSAAASKVIINLLECFMLRELRVEKTKTARQIFNTLPVGLEHLALGVHGDVSLQPVLQFIKKTETLKTLTMHLWNGAESHEQLDAVKIACARQGVDLQFTKDIRTFRSISVCRNLLGIDAVAHCFYCFY
ncbi:unnamed protein product [Somion occarium]|uniref:F-box domain-containing protein n=1 Tax=Somion occarium TaxID=3059160 RepID=A0ABP1CEI4_9APHY